jgi:hypothetical protein
VNGTRFLTLDDGLDLLRRLSIVLARTSVVQCTGSIDE